MIKEENVDFILELDVGAEGKQGEKGETGKTGATYTPAVKKVENGHELSWTNDGGLVNPPNVFIKDGDDFDIKELNKKENWATIKVNSIPEINDEATLRTYFYDRRKSESRKWQIEVSQDNNQNIIAGLGGFPNGATANDSGFVYIELPFSEAGGFIIDATYESREKGYIYKQRIFGTLDSRWHTTGWYDASLINSPQHTTLVVTAMTEGRGYKSDFNSQEIKRHSDGGGVVILRFNAPDGSGEQSYQYETYDGGYAIFRRSVVNKSGQEVKRIIIKIDSNFNVTQEEEIIKVATQKDLITTNNVINEVNKKVDTNKNSTDKSIAIIQEQVVANNDELNQVVGEVSDVKQDIGLLNQEQTLQNKAIQKNVDDILAREKFATIKDDETSDIVSVETFRTHFYNLRKSEARKYQFEVEPGKNENIVTGAGGLPEGEDLKDKGFIYVEIPFSEAGGFIIDIIYENRSKNKLYNKKDYSTLNSNWKSTGWYEVGAVGGDSNLRPQVVSNTKRIKTLEENIFDSGVATGEFINIKDSATAELQKVSAVINKAQDTTNGVQLFNIKKIQESSRLKATDDTITLTAPVDNWSIGLFNELISGYKLNDKIYVNAEIKDGKNIIYIDGIPGRTTIGASFVVTQKLLDNPNSKIYFYTNAPEKPMEIKNLIFSKENVPYEPYTGGIASPNPDYPQEIVKVSADWDTTTTGKNLFDKSKVVSGILNADGSISPSNYFVSDFIRVSSSKEYYKSATGSARVKFFDKDKKVISTESYADLPLFESAKKFNAPFGNASYMRFCVARDLVDGFQLELGSKATAYEPYVAITNTNELKGNEFLPGDEYVYQFNEEDGRYWKYLKKNMGKYTFTGDEVFFLSENYIFFTRIDGISVIKEDGYCNYYTSKTDLSTEDGISFAPSTQPIVKIRNNKTATVDEFATYVRGLAISKKPLEIVYNLETPELIPIAPIDIMNMSYNPVTNGFSSIDNIKLTFNYYRDFIHTIANLQLGEKTLKSQLDDLTTRVEALENTPTAEGGSY